ncbi:WXG100 family type VII secretion target, partial [Streptomyces albidoflavus]
MPGRRPAFPHIGWDPTPGDVADTRDLAKTLGGLATDLGEAVRDLDRIDAGAWKGKAANAFVEYVGEDVTPLIRKSHQSFGKASRALHRWS